MKLMYCSNCKKATDHSLYVQLISPYYEKKTKTCLECKLQLTSKLRINERNIMWYYCEKCKKRTRHIRFHYDECLRCFEYLNDFICFKKM